MPETVVHLTPQQIGEAGEKIVQAAFIADGWLSWRDTLQPGKNDIVAKKGTVVRRVQVKTTYLYSGGINTISSDDRNELVRYAAIVGQEPWVASLTVNICGGLVGRINWERVV